MNFPRIRCRSASSTLLMLGAWMIAAGTSACVQDMKDAPPDRRVETKGNSRLKPEYDASGKLRKIEYDRNNDGKVDAWGYMDGSRVVRVETDENGDGQVDRWEFHRDATPAAPVTPQDENSVDRTIERIELSTRFDGRVSRTEYFTDGVLTKIEEDANGDGKIDKWETYTNGSLSLLELDTQGRGTPDRRLIYRPDGSFDHIEADSTGSGTFTTLKQ